MDRGRFLVPIAILCAGVLVAGAVFYVNRPATDLDVVYRANDQIASPSGTEATAVAIRSVNADDHILGSPNARVVVIEYADIECPHCKSFHRTMRSVIDKYGTSGDVAWVFRHLPFVRLHSKAAEEAEATECASELGGESVFWKFTDRLFDVTPSDNNLDLAVLPEIAAFSGLDRDAFMRCLASGRHKASVQKSFDDAVAAGLDATPYIILIAKDGTRVDLRGDQEYDELVAEIEKLLVNNTPLFE